MFCVWSLQPSCFAASVNVSIARENEANPITTLFVVTTNRGAPGIAPPDQPLCLPHLRIAK